MSLDNIDHIVVLMLENRSFDHMLGYLSHPSEGRNRADVDGLTGNETNDHNGVPFPVQLMASAVMNGDPCHAWECVKDQLDNNNGGFVDNYADKVVGESNPEFIMHYFNGAGLPAYDHLAREFSICDRWFCPVPGPTQPNRAYSLAGTSDGLKENFTPKQLFGGAGFAGKTIFEMLPAHVTWAAYSHDISSLRFFKKFGRSLVPQIDKIDKFYNHAQLGTLPNVSWIDPDFGIAVYPGPPNDDHPTHDVRYTQNLVARVYNALLTSPNWSRILFIITYDEHGGFYDHVSPRQFTPADSNAGFDKYGPRVPALVISPWVGRQLCYGSNDHGLGHDKVLFDHTSVLKTILRRFVSDASGNIPTMVARVDEANDLGALLTEQQARNDCTAAPMISNLPPPSLKDLFLLEEQKTELQEELDMMVARARAEGVPANKL